MTAHRVLAFVIHLALVLVAVTDRAPVFENHWAPAPIVVIDLVAMVVGRPADSEMAGPTAARLAAR